MRIKARWVGFDWGETVLDPSRGYEGTKKAINEIFLKLGKPEIINEKLMRFDKLLKEFEYDRGIMDGIEEPNEIKFWERHFRFKRLVDEDMKRFFSYVLDNDQDAIEIYRKKQFEYLKPANGLKECLAYLKSKGICVNIVSDLGGDHLLKLIPEFLKIHGLKSYFSEIITNRGKIRCDGSLDMSYKGLEKKDGTLYRKLIEDLNIIGILPSQTVIIGDRLIEDIERAKICGFKTIQFTGIIKRRPSNVADYTLSDLTELKNILTGL